MEQKPAARRPEMSVPLANLAAAFCLLLTPALGDQLYPYGPLAGDIQLPTGDDVVEPVTLVQPIGFYGQRFDTIFVHTNGLVSFLTEIPKFFNEPFPLEYPIIAPLYSNIDTRGSGSVYYRESSNLDDLEKIRDKLTYLYPSQDFTPDSAFIVTWDKVGYHKMKGDKTNTFQLVISSSETESFVEIIYPENGITWIQAESPEGGLPDAKAQAGISFPERDFVKITGSGTDQVFNLPRRNNTSVYPGTFIFRIGNIYDGDKPQPPEIETNYEDEEEFEPQSCSDGAMLCHKYSECYDQPEGGFCCQCNRGFFGDGINCLDFEAHRLQGKLNISIGAELLKDINMQAFIVTGDGRTYTALTGIPRTLGFSMQLLTNIGSFVGFLFAKPFKNAPNGYRLTGGVLNHTMQITINNKDHITINQRFTGVDVYDQLNMEAEIIGTLPYVSKNRLNVIDYAEQFTKIEAGLFRSISNHSVVVDNSNENFNLTVDQTITFKEHCPSANKNVYSLLFKAARHYLSYEENDNILRFASSNKISENTDGINPCHDAACVTNSACIVDEDSYKCVCNPGFETAIGETSGAGCVDINECEDGLATCYHGAVCINEIGTYKCQCPPGLSGDGHVCERPLSLPENGNCTEVNGEPVCVCNEGFQLRANPEGTIYCIDINECDMQACSPDSENCENTEGSYFCTCKRGFHEVDGTCMLISDEGCHTMNCPEGSECVELPEGPTCQCQPPYQGTPPHCGQQNQPIGCPNMYCPERSACQELPEGPTCLCILPYVGTAPHCRLEYERIEGCYTLNCPEGSACQELPEGPTCLCIPPYVGTAPHCELENEPIGGCDTMNCPEGSECVELPEGPTCQCQPPYQGTPPHCGQQNQPIGGCDTMNCPEGSACEQFPEGPTCLCISPYQGTPPHCRLENQQTDLCRLDSDCRENEICQYNNKYETYICNCISGYYRLGENCRLPYANELVEINPNTCEGQDDCSCPQGFYEHDDHSCVKVSPVIQACQEGSCPPHASCKYDETKNISGCVCNSDFLANEHGSCSPVDNSCSPDIRELCDVQADCIYNYTSDTFQCICRDGYIGDGKTCELTKNTCENCHPIAICVDNTCICPEGTLGDGIYSCEKDTLSCQNCHQEATCVYDLEEGYICQCNEGFEGDGYTCDKIITCSTNPEICSEAATCIFNGSSFECVCDGSYEGNGTHCLRKESEISQTGYIMISKGISIIRYPIESPPHGRGQIVHFYGEQQIIGIAVDCVKERLYWSDIISSTIQSSDYNGSNTELFVKTGIKSPEGLVVDWINRILYWTDSTLRLISYAHLEDKIVHNIITTGLVNPRGIAVNPFTRKLYWSDWSRRDPVIASSDLDGQNPEVLIDKSNIALPNSLAIDWDTNELCWADAGAKQIGCYNLNTQEIRVVVENCVYPFGLAITTDTYYWSDWSIGTVMSSTKGSLKPTGNLSLVLEERPGIYGLAVTSRCQR